MAYVRSVLNDEAYGTTDMTVLRMIRQATRSDK